MPTRWQWIDLPPAFHLEALSAAPAGSPLASVLSSSPGASSPPIHRAPNRFFDSLTLLDKARARGLGTGGAAGGFGVTRNGTSSSSLATLSKETPFDGTQSGSHTPPKPDEHVIELQFQMGSIATCAHYGYVVSMYLEVSWRPTRAWLRLLMLLWMPVAVLHACGEKQ